MGERVYLRGVWVGGREGWDGVGRVEGVYGFVDVGVAGFTLENG